MLDGLVAVGVVAHIHHLHLAYLVDDKAVVAVVEDGRYGEHRVHHLVERGVATHQVDKSLRVVEYAPGVVPAVAFGEGVTPLERVEGCLELAVLQLAAHQTGLGVEYLAVVHGAQLEWAQLLVLLAQCLAHLVDTPVVVGILQGTGHILLDVYIVGHIAQLVVVFVSETAGRAYLGVNCLGTVYHSLPQRLGVGSAHSFDDGVGHYRCRIVAHHAAAVAGRRPFGQEAALAVSIGETLLHLGVL